MGAHGATQLSFADLGAQCAADEVSLRETTFVVVDLETTGGRTKASKGSKGSKGSTGRCPTRSPRSGR